ncbi:MAG TPA: TIM barrel protein [Terracidiphilus sp.]|jgi:hydroxypyruvate isomerase|nr:TIM barrel protein [Terracidiphilus sp.]
MDRRTFTQVLTAGALGAISPWSASASSSDANPTATPFPLSVMLWTVFRELPFEERLAKVAEAGYTNIELVGEYAKWTDADFAKANAARKQLGLRFDATAGLHHGVADATVRDAFLAELKDAFKPMETLSCPAMIVLSGNVVPGTTRDDQHNAAIETLKHAAALVEGRTIDGQPVRLLLECIDPEENPKYFLQSAAEAIEIVRAVNHPQVQFLYDMFHEQIAEGNLIEKLDKHIDVIGLIHIADVPGRHEPGTGEINYANVYRKLAQLNYKHVAAMEFRPSGDPVASLRAAREMVARAVTA